MVTQAITRTQEYRESDNLQRAFARAVASQPFIGRSGVDRFLVESNTDPDVAYIVELPRGDITHATCQCQHFERNRYAFSYENRACTHIAVAFIFYHNLYERFSAGIPLAIILESIKPVGNALSTAIASVQGMCCLCGERRAVSPRGYCALCLEQSGA